MKYTRRIQKMKNIEKYNYDELTDEVVYDVFEVSGHESQALSDTYFELFELIGKDAMLKLFKYYRGNKLDYPMRLYNLEFITELVEKIPNKKERAKIARVAGFSYKTIEKALTQKRKENKK